MDFASSSRAAEDRTRWKGILAYFKVICSAPTTSQGYGRDYRENVNLGFTLLYIINKLKLCESISSLVNIVKVNLLGCQIDSFQCSEPFWNP